MNHKQPSLFPTDQAGNQNGFQLEGVTRAMPDPKFDPAGNAGYFLQLEREARGMSLDDVAAQIGIHPYHLHAIEIGDMTNMPARMEALEMIAAYADSLGFEPEPLCEHYVSFLPAPLVAPKHHPAAPAPLSSAKILQFGKIVPRLANFDVRSLKMPSMPSLGGGNNNIVASAAGFLMLFGGTMFMLSGQTDVVKTEKVATLSEQVVGDPMPTASTGPEVAKVEVVETPIANAKLAVTDKPADSDDDSLGSFIAQQVEDDVEATVPVEPKSKSKKKKKDQARLKIDNGTAAQVIPEPNTLGTATGEGRIILKAQSKVWVSVVDAEGNPLMTQMLEAGDTYKVPNKDGLMVMTRDGGKLSFMIDGQDKGLIGAPGEIVTGEPLSVEALQAKG